MLQHRSTSTEQPQTSEHQRVTPEELAQALAAIEARKDESARDAAGTIPIGEAVQQLGFDATSDEIWQEVQAQRQRHTLQVTSQLPRKARAGVWIAVCFGIMLLVGLVHSIPSSDDVPPPAVVSASVQPVMPSTRPTVLKTLGEIADGETFWCDPDTASKILLKSSRPASQVVVNSGLPTMGNQAGISWVFTKHTGELYLHGYIAPSSAEALQQGNTTIFNEPLDNTQQGGLNYSQQITLPMGGFRVQSYTPIEQAMPQQITVSNIHPDQHFKDRW